MDKTEKIINALKQGKKPAEVTSIHGKDGFTPAEQEKLVGQVADLWDTPFSYPLLQTMYLISRDEWYRLKVLSLSAQHPSQTGENRMEILNNLGKTLNSLKAVSPEQKRTWTRCQAIYLGIQALTLTEEGNLPKALQLYKQALEKYQQLGLTTPAARVQANIVHLQSRMNTRMITPAELSAASSPKIVESRREQTQMKEGPTVNDAGQTGETIIRPEQIVPTEEPIQKTEDQNKEALPGVEQERPAENLDEGISNKISEYLSRQDQSPSINESEDTGWQQSSEYPSSQNTTPTMGEFTQPVWWQTGDALPDQDQLHIEQTLAMPKKEPTAENSFIEAKAPPISEPVKPVAEQTSGEHPVSVPILSSHEILDDIDQLNDKHNQIKSEIETLQQKIDEQFRVNAEKILALADQQLSLERQIQQMRQRAKDLADHQ